jgi:hypothetical protein
MIQASFQRLIAALSACSRRSRIATISKVIFRNTIRRNVKNILFAKR